MAFSVSAGVNVQEVDLTTIVPATSTTEAAIAGVFRWGPIGQAILVDSETSLVSSFGAPTNLNGETFFVAADFLSFGNRLYVSRAANTTDNTGTVGVLSAIANTGPADLLPALIKNKDDFEVKVSGIDSDIQFIAKYPGALGNSLKVSVCETAGQFRSVVANTVLFPANSSINVATSAIKVSPGNRFAEVTVFAANATIVDTLVGAYANTSLTAFQAAASTGDLLTIGGQKLKISSYGNISTVSTANGFVSTYRVNFVDEYTQPSPVSITNVERSWEYSNLVDGAPNQSTYVGSFGNTAALDEVHVVISDDGGQFTGVPGTVLEVYQGVSRATNARANDGSNLFYKNVINDGSAYVWATADRPGATSNNALNVTTSTNVKPLSLRFAGGSDGADEATVTLGTLANAYDIFKQSEQIDVSIIIAGKAVGGTLGEGIGKYIKDNIVEYRKDCVVTISPPRTSVVNNPGNEATSTIAFRNALGSSSYAFLDSGYEYRYDKYNDVYRWVPLNGNIAGAMVRTDETRDPWFSPAGYNRGQLKNVIKLAYNPSKTDRDLLYKNAINPVSTFPGQGTILFGDKTLQTKPSAFDRINVRRLFIVLEKAIATASQYSLFEFNDEFTRAQFRSLVDPFLRDVKGRRGIEDYKVICDDTNNTSAVINANEFRGDIYIKPSRSINFINLKFIAVRNGVEFSEVVGS